MILENMTSTNVFNLKIDACPICHSQKIKPWITKERAGLRFKIFRCSTCDSGFLNPPPSKEYLASIYATSGHGLTHPVSFAEILRAEAECPNSTVDAKRIVGHAKQLLGLQEARGLRALDIGSGYGFYTRAAMEAGFAVFAVNPGTWENEIFVKMNGFQPIQEFFEGVDLGDEKFDLIILSQVLEHVQKPLFLLHKIKSILRPGGVIAIAVPNVNSFLVKLLGAKENGCLWVPEHVSYFSKDGLVFLLKRAGFKIMQHLFISRIPYYAVSNRLDLQGIGRNLSNSLVEHIQ